MHIMSTQPIYNSALSFGAMKKSQFNGIDFAVVEKFKAPIEKFNTNDDFQDWADKRQRTVIDKPLGGKSAETVKQREFMKLSWVDSMLNTGYTPAERLLILNGVTKNLNKNDDTFLPSYNDKVLRQTVDTLKTELADNPKLQFDFGKRYKDCLKNYYLENTLENGTGWIIIPSQNNDQQNFRENVRRVQTLSSERWCTKGIHAPIYLSQGDFHIYMENGVAKIGLKFIDNSIDEIEDDKNKCIMSPKYFEILKAHIEDNKYSFHDNTRTIYSIATKKYEEAKAAEKTLGADLKNCDAEKIFNYTGIKTKRNKKGELIISHYAQPKKCSFEDYGIDEDKLLQQVSEIEGDADFKSSKATSLWNVKKIGGNAEFTKSEIQDLGELKIIGGDANFAYSRVNHLKNLELIKGNAKFGYSSVNSLGNLQEIGKDANFYYSNVCDMGELRKIGGDANFSYTIMDSLGYLEKIGGSALFTSTKLRNLGLLREIGGNAVFNKLKINDINPLEKVGGNLEITDSSINSLGILKKVMGSVTILNSHIEQLGRLEYIGGKINTDDSLNTAQQYMLHSIKDYTAKKESENFLVKLFNFFFE